MHHFVRIFPRALFIVFLLAAANVKSQSAADSIEIYDPFRSTDELRILIKTHYSVLDIKSKKLVDDLLHEAASLKEPNNASKKGELYIQIGDIFYRKGMYFAAIQQYYNALQDFEKKNDLLKSARVKIKLGRAYYFSDFLPEVDYYKSALRILEKSSYKEDKAIASYLAGLEEGIPFKKKTMFMKALELQKQVLKENPKDISAKENLAIILNANDYLDDAMKIAREINNNHLLVVYINNLGFRKVLDKKYDEALRLFRSSLEICKQEGLKALARNTFDNFSRVYRLQGNWEKAAKYQQLMHIIEESLFTERNLIKAAEYRIKYETEKKEIENEFLKKEKDILAGNVKIQKTLSFVLSLAILAIAGILGLVYASKRKLKTAYGLLDQKNLELEELYNEKAKSEKNLKEAQTTAHLANWEYDKTTSLFKFSDELQQIFGAQNIINKESFVEVLERVIQKEELEKVAQFFFDSVCEKQIKEIEFRIKVNENPKWIKAKSVVRCDLDNNVIGIFGTIQDISDTKEQERIKHEIEAQHIYTKQLIKSLEEERKRIAGELHDGLGQDILIIKNRAVLALQNQSIDNSSKYQFAEIDKSISSILQSVRDVSLNLRPVHLERLGLTETIISTIKKNEGNGVIEFHNCIDNIDGIMDVDNELHFYRIIQEAINNILKHSEAREAYIEVIKNDEEINLLIKDDGKGFDVATTLERGSGLGLQNLHNRVMLLNGSVNIQSKIKEGTTIEIIIPLEMQNGKK